MKQIITHFTDDDLYKFSMCCAVIDNYPRAQVKYMFVDRNNTVYPKGFAQLVREQIRMLEGGCNNLNQLAKMAHQQGFSLLKGKIMDLLDEFNKIIGKI